MATRKQLEQQFIEDRAFWGSVSARWRGLAGGVLLGGLIGATLGLGAAGVYAALTDVAFAEMGKATLLGLVGFFSGSSMLVGGTLWGLAGSISGGVASGLVAQKELEQDRKRSLDQEVTLPSVASVNAPTDNKPFFNWKVMSMGALITGSVGAFLAITGALPTGVSYLLLGQQSGSAMGAAAAATTLGMFGAVFGINFKPWQAFKRWSDGLFEGRLNKRSAESLHILKEQLLAVPTPERDISASKNVCYSEKILEQRRTADAQPAINL